MESLVYKEPKPVEKILTPRSKQHCHNNCKLNDKTVYFRYGILHDFIWCELLPTIRLHWGWLGLLSVFFLLRSVSFPTPLFYLIYLLPLVRFLPSVSAIFCLFPPISDFVPFNLLPSVSLFSFPIHFLQQHTSFQHFKTCCSRVHPFLLFRVMYVCTWFCQQ